ncbi:UDP-glycosyltransferase UGT5 [Anabrus simplex]|uniref:UDP-glycosyltransferase UGT5 n=1 Tax=Anabrus simplex TaxID=316456 RepID=UPI0035A39A25
MSGESCWWKAAVLFVILSSSHAARILAVIPMPVKSHSIVFLSLMEELAARQHQVTVISYFPQEKPRPNYTDIPLDKEKLKQFGRRDMFAMNDMSSFMKLSMLWIIGNFCGIILEEPQVQQLIHSKDQQFDLVITEAFFNEALFGFAHVFKAPLIVLCPFGGTHWMGHMVGNPSPFAYVPDIFLSYGDHMTFIQRLHNTVLGVYALLGRALFYIPQQNAIMRKYFNHSESLPSLWEVQHKTALFLANSHVSVNYPRPLVPNFIEVGGMHIKPPKKLPQDLQNYLDDAPDGVIYFSMGSALRSTEFPEIKRRALLDTFSKLKQKVLWKWEDDNLPDQPPNLRISKWFPQADILAHPNIKLFITHGGLLSTLETIYHGVPIVGIPVFGDQQMNMVRAETAGFGILVEYSNLTTESLHWAVTEVLQQPRYRENAKRLSRIYRDQPESPMERAVYWVEYIHRHRGAPHLRSAALDLAWYQYFLLDVMAVILAVVISVVLFIYVVIKTVIRMLKSMLAKPSRQTKKKKN